jgi:outer membrane protein assembly factor BamB
MRTALPLLFVSLVATLLPRAVPADPPTALGPDADTVAADEQALQRVKLPADGPALLDYFRKRTLPQADPARLETLVRRLGDDEFSEREKAHAELLTLGASALPGLRRLEADWDAETRRRVLDLRGRIEEKADPAVQAATARLIAHGKPAGAADVLLAYLPFAADDSVADEICKALGAVAVRGGEVEAVVTRALKDKQAIKRAAAGEALLRARGVKAVADVRPLLKDTDPRVRLRVALSLVPLHQEKEASRAAVTALVDVLAELPAEQLWAAEDVLVRLAGEQAPSVSLGGDEAERKQARRVWNEWWQKNKDRIDLANLDKTEPFLGRTLLVMQGNRGVVGRRLVRLNGEVQELDPHKKVLWKFSVENTYPVDARIVGPDRVLLAEYNGRRVTERDFKGNIIWSHQINGNPISAQRLPGGNTFIVSPNRLVEVDRKGAEVFAWDRPPHDIIRGFKTRRGEVIVITNQGNLTRLDGKTRKEIKSFVVGHVGNLFGSIDVLPNGHILVPQFNTNRVAEFDVNGKEVWHAAVNLPCGVMRLPNGHILVSSLNTRRAVELDRSGREVWSYQTENMQQLFQARRR